MIEETPQAGGPEPLPGPPTLAPPPPSPPGWRSGLRDLARGLEAGFWFSGLFTLVACGFMFGASCGGLWAAGLSWDAAGIRDFAGLWFGVIAGCGLVISIPVGVTTWLARGIGSRLGRQGVPSQVRRRRRRRRWLVAAVLVSAGTLAGLAGGGYLGRVALREMNEAIAETDALDPYWRLEDLLATRVEVLDEENSAFLVDEAQELTPKDWPWRPRRIDPDEVGPPAPQGAETALGRASTIDASIRLDDASTEALRAELTDLDEAVGIALEVADYDWGRNELEMGPVLIDPPLPHAQPARTVARLLWADAILSVQDGEPDEAVEACLAIFGVARSFGDEPIAVSQRVRLAIDALALQATRRVLAQDEPSDEWLAALQDWILYERNQPLSWYGLRGERAILVELIRRVSAGEVIVDMRGRPHPAAADSAVRVDLLTAIRALYEISVSLRWFNEMLIAVEGPETGWIAGVESVQAKIREVANSRLGPFTSLNALKWMPEMMTLVSYELRIRAELGATALLIAAERQRQETGSWPESVDDIDEEILPEAPLDPYSGEPYRMQYRDGRLRIYSVGPNLRDEGGAYDPRKWGKAEVDDDAGAVGYDPELRGRPAEDADDQP